MSRAARERPELLILCGALGFAGSLAPLAAMALSVPVAEHDFLGDTVSDLGRGPHAWIMDTGFYLDAGALLALAIAAAHLHLGRWFWSLGILCLALTALVVTLLGIWDEFNPEAAEDLSVHTRISFLLAPLYLAGPLAMARGAARLASWMAPAFIASALLWSGFAVAFKLAPDSYDGILEKAALTATWLWTLPLSWLFLRRGIRDARAG